MTTYLTGPEVRARLALSPSQLRSLAHRKTDPIPHLKVGTAYRIPLSALEAWEQRNLKGQPA